MATYNPAVSTVVLTADEVRLALISYVNATLGLNIENAATMATAGTGNFGVTITFDSRNS